MASRIRSEGVSHDHSGKSGRELLRGATRVAPRSWPSFWLDDAAALQIDGLPTDEAACIRRHFGFSRWSCVATVGATDNARSQREARRLRTLALRHLRQLSMASNDGNESDEV